MKQMLMAALAAVLLGHPTALVAAGAVPISVAIFDFESRDESVKELGSKVAVLLNAQLSTRDNLILVERVELDKALGEQELGLSGTVSTETVAKVGHLTGARVLVTGKVLKLDKEIML